MRFRHFGVVAVAAVTAAFVAASAQAASFRPAASGLTFTPLTAQEVQQAPTCQRGLLCYTPQMIQQAYDVPTGPTAPTGAGETIVVVVAYGSPFLAADVDNFDQVFGLPDANLGELDQQTVYAPVGSNAFQTWALETSLDVEWAHAIAPGARIVVAVAANDDTSNLAEMTREAIQAYPDAIVVNSFGGDESGLASDPDAENVMDKAFASLALHGGTAVAASGDLGATNNTIFTGVQPTPMASYPASSPLVLAVGGTEGNAYPGGLWNNGQYGGEQVWNEVFLDTGQIGASGGAPSTVYPLPIWQRGVAAARGGRAVPDVAWNAAANGGVIISFGGQFGAIGGTSAAAPQWAGVLALANELRAKAHRSQVGLVTPVLYFLGRDKATYRQDFHDITVGNNVFADALGSGLPGFSAGAGYDYATGLGTPDVSHLLASLAATEPSFSRFGDLLTSHGHGHGHVTFHPGR